MLKKQELNCHLRQTLSATRASLYFVRLLRITFAPFTKILTSHHASDVSDLWHDRIGISHNES